MSLPEGRIESGVDGEWKCKGGKGVGREGGGGGGAGWKRRVEKGMGKERGG